MGRFWCLPFVLLWLLPNITFGSSGISYHGKILKPNGNPVNSSTTQFRIQILSPGSERCILWEETQTKDLSETSGVFSITINDATEPSLIVNTLPFTIERVFSNKTGFTGLTCSSGTTYTPSSQIDGRILQAYFREATSGPWEQVPVLRINYVPLALNSVQLQGYQASEFLKIDPYVGQTPLSNANVNSLLNLIAGTSTAYVKPTDALGGDLAGTFGAGSVVGIRGRAITSDVPAAGQVLKFDGTAWAPANDDSGGSMGDASYAAKGIVRFDTDAATSGITVAAGVARLADTITAAGPVGGASTVPVITYDAKGRLTTVSTATVNDTSKLPLAGGTMTGPVNMGLFNITNATSVAANNFSGRNLLLTDVDTNTITLRTPNDISANYTLTLPLNAPTNGYVLSSDATGQLSWIPAAGGSVTAVTATAPVLSSGGATPVISLDTGLGASKIPQVGGGALAANGVVVANGLGTALASLNCAVNQVIKFDASGFATCGADNAADPNAILNGGNSFAADATIGTNDAYALNFETQGTTKMTVLANGNVGVGTMNPSSLLHVETDAAFGIGALLKNPNSGASASTRLDFHNDLSGVGGLQGFSSGTAAPFSNRFLVFGSSGLDLMASNGGSDMRFYTAGNATTNERMRITSTGNVGVGTSSPTGRFQVYLDESSLSTAYGLHSTVIYRTTGSSVAVRGTASFRGGASVGSTKGAEFIASTATSSGADLTDLIGTTSTASHVSTTSRVTNLVGAINKATISASTGGLVTNAVGSSNIIDSSVGGSITDARAGYFEVNSSNAITIGNAYGVHIGNVRGTNKFSLYATDASAPSYFAGNVGIGTTSPLHKLDVRTPSQSSTVAANIEYLSQVATSEATPLALRFGVRTTPTPENRFGSIEVDEAGVKRNLVVQPYGGNVGIGTTSPATKLDVAGALRIGNDATACAAGLAGSLRYNSGVVEYCNGSAWQPFGVSGGGLTALNGQSGSTQTFANGATGTAPAFSSAANVHTLNIPLASGAGVTSGTISKIDYDNFDSKLTSPLTTKGDILVQNATVPARLPAGTNGQVLSANSATATGLEWIAAPTMVSGLGANQTPQVGAVALAANGIVVANGAGTALTSLNCTTGQVIKFNISGVAECATDNTGATNAFVQSGNSFGVAATLGTDDAFPLNFETQGTTKMTVLANGNVGVGTVNPEVKLDIVGAARSLPVIINTGGAVDLSLSNVFKLKDVQGSTIALSNPMSGGTYTIYVSDTTSRTYTFSGCTNTYFNSANGPTQFRSAYTILVIVDSGDTDCIINWQTGYN